MATRDEVIEAIRRLPDDASLDEILQQIYVVLKVGRAIAAGEAGDKVSLEEARKEAKSWAPK